MQKKYFKYGALIAAISVSFILDKQVANALEGFKIGILDVFFVLIKRFGQWPTAFAFVNAIFIINALRKKWKAPKITKVTKITKQLSRLWAGFFIAGIVSVAIKYLFGRERPFSALGLNLVPGMDYAFPFWDTSFPSWHAVAFFTLLPFLNYQYPRFRVFWITSAAVVGLSRIYLGVHYLSDVVVGAIIGFYIGVYSLNLGKKSFAKC